MVCLSWNPIEERSTKDNYPEDYVINILSELFKQNHKNGQPLNTDRKILTTDQSPSTALTTNRKSTSEIVSPKKFIPDIESQVFTFERTQATRSINKNRNFIEKINKFAFTDLKMERKFAYEYHHCGANKNIMDIINKRDESTKLLPLMEERPEITKPGNLQFKTDNNLIRKVWVPRQPDKRRDEVGAIDLQLLFRSNESNR